MAKIIKLTEADLNKLIQKVLMETVGEEPIMDNRDYISAYMGFGEGKTTPSTFNGYKGMTQADLALVVDELVRFLTRDTNTIKTLQKFYTNPNAKIPKFITVNVSTSHTGSGETNAAVAQGRINFLTGIVQRAFDKIGLDASVAKKFIVANSDVKYDPSKLDKNFYDPKKVKPNSNERYGYIKINAMDIKGLTTSGIQGVQKGLNSGSSIVNTWVVDGVDEETIVNNIQKLQTYSDIQDLDKAINASGSFDGLEDFLNSQLFDDPAEMRIVAQHLKKCALASQKQADTIRTVPSSNGVNISIGLNN